jgi:mannose-1-phosphate guanylyltransferase
MKIGQAFLLGAGLGTRLRPLTDRLPKPLVPLFHRPLAAWVADACTRCGVGRLAVNTHHLPHAWESFACREDTRHLEISFFHEPVLLDTGGGLRNIASWMHDEPLLVHNGDIFSSMPLGKLIAAHEASGLPATLALRSDGEARHVAFDPSRGLATDIRMRLGRSEGTHLFSGIYCIRPDFMKRIAADGPVSVIPAFLELAARDELGAVVIDDGEWWDLGNRASYLQAHRTLNLAPPVHPDARVANGAELCDSAIGPGAVVEAGAVLRGSVVWPGCHIAGDARLDNCIVFSDRTIRGAHRDADL